MGKNLVLCQIQGRISFSRDVASEMQSCGEKVVFIDTPFIEAGPLYKMSNMKTLRMFIF